MIVIQPRSDSNLAEKSGVAQHSPSLFDILCTVVISIFCPVCETCFSSWRSIRLSSLSSNPSKFMKSCGCFQYLLFWLKIWKWANKLTESHYLRVLYQVEGKEPHGLWSTWNEIWQTQSTLKNRHGRVLATKWKYLLKGILSSRCKLCSYDAT